MYGLFGAPITAVASELNILSRVIVLDMQFLVYIEYNIQ